MPFGFPDPTDVAGDIAAGVQDLLGDAAGAANALAGRLADALGGPGGLVDATAAEWEEFLDSLTANQLEAMAALTAFTGEAQRFLAGAATSRDDLLAASLSPEQVARQVLRGWELVTSGAAIARELLDAFDGDLELANAIADNCPLVGRTIGVA